MAEGRVEDASEKVRLNLKPNSELSEPQVHPPKPNSEQRSAQHYSKTNENLDFELFGR